MRSIVRTAHTVVVAVFTAGVVIQVLLAGLGVFASAGAFLTHRDFGYLLGTLTLVLVVLALVGREPRRVTGLSALLLVLFALQSVFIAVRTTAPEVAALHPLNGFLILLGSVVLARWSWEARSPEPGVARPAGPVPAAAGRAQ